MNIIAGAMKNGKRIGAILALITSVITAYIAVDSHYAKAAQVRALELRVEQKIISDRIDRLQERIWRYEDRYKDFSNAPIEAVYEWRTLQEEKKGLERQQKILDEKNENSIK